MAAPQQFTSRESTGVALFYTPPPKDMPNIFAEFLSNFLMTRTPWTRQVFNQRLAALDPEGQYRMLAAGQRLKADLLNREAVIDAQARQMAASEENARLAYESARMRAMATMYAANRSAESRMYSADVDQETELAKAGQLSDDGEDLYRRTQARAQAATRGIREAVGAAEAEGVPAEEVMQDPRVDQAFRAYDQVFGNYREERRMLRPVEAAALDQLVQRNVIDAAPISDAGTRAMLSERAQVSGADYGEAAKGPTPRREEGAPRQYRRQPGQMGGKDPGGLEDATAPGPVKGARGAPMTRTSRAKALASDLRGDSRRLASSARPSPAGGQSPPVPPAAGAVRGPTAEPNAEPPAKASPTDRLRQMQQEVDRDTRAAVAARNADPFGPLGDFNDPLPTRESLAGEYRPDLSALNDRQFARVGRWLERAQRKNPQPSAPMRDPRPPAANPQVRGPADVRLPPPKDAPAPKAPARKAAPAPAQAKDPGESLDDMLARLMPAQSEYDERDQPPGESRLDERDQPPGESAPITVDNVDRAPSSRFADAKTGGGPYVAPPGGPPPATYAPAKNAERALEEAAAKRSEGQPPSRNLAALSRLTGIGSWDEDPSIPGNAGYKSGAAGRVGPGQRAASAVAGAARTVASEAGKSASEIKAAAAEAVDAADARMSEGLPAKVVPIGAGYVERRKPDPMSAMTAAREASKLAAEANRQPSSAGRLLAELREPETDTATETEEERRKRTAAQRASESPAMRR